MLGGALLDLCPAGLQAVGVDLRDGDITVREGAWAAIAPHAPAAVIHCAAYTDVDGCTQDPGTAFRVNATGTQNVARVAHECGAYLIAISTDYVFDGEAGRPYVETDAPNPINPYGESKLRGEELAQEAHDRVLIARTQWLYGPGGRNFVRTIVTNGQELGELRAVADEFGSPTYTRDFARRVWELVQRQPTGVLHSTNSGITTRAELARTALAAAGAGAVTVHEISAREWESPTRRPRYSPLGSVRMGELCLAPLRAWDEAVCEYASEYLQRTG